MSYHLASRPASGLRCPSFPSLLRFFALATLSSALSLAAPAQNSSPSPQVPAADSEISMHDSESTFQLHVNLVQVRVVVRDSSGKPVANLHREDFQVYDQGKLQVITSFDVDTPESRRERAAAALKTQASAATSPDTTKVSIPERFVALTFDDVHLAGDDAARVRVAASKFLQGLLPSDRVAVHCTSGQCTPQEFTSDTNLLNKAIAAILPHPLLEPATGGSAPQASYGPPIAAATYGAAADFNAILYAHLAEILRRLAAMPGQRVLLLVSPGFGTNLQDATGFASAMSDSSGIIGSANRFGIVINTLDARSLYAPGYLSPANQFTADPLVTSQVINASNSAEFENLIVLQDFAAGTGGTFFQNSNDLAGGLTGLGSAPEVSYLLGFSPQNQKTNGQFHLLKVKLAGNLKYDIQARRGYFAPNKVDDPKEQAWAEIDDAIYSQGEIQDFPLELQTQYFKTGDSGARLSVVSRLGVKSLRFRRDGDRNLDNVTIATAIFDENGNVVTGAVKNVEMHLLDATYARLSRTGLNVKTVLDLHPGKYMVRQVVRDSEGSQMAARNGVVSISMEGRVVANEPATDSPPKEKPKPELASLRVCLRLPDETPFPASASVVLRPNEGHEIPLGAADTRGDFLLSEVKAGKYLLEVNADGYQPIQLVTEVEEGHRQRTLFVVMEPRPAPSEAARLGEPERASKAATATKVDATGMTGTSTAAGTKVERNYWRPHELEELVPPVDASATCNMPALLQGVGERMRESVSTLEKFTATENVEHYDVDRNGARKGLETRSFAYSVMVTLNKEGTFQLEEFRNGSSDPDQFPAHIALMGTPAIDLLFHPRLASDFNFRCEGLGKWQGREAWQVHFVQREDRPVRIRSYRVGGSVYSVALEGRAWIAPEDYQVVRLESELAKPIPEIKLTQEHIAIDYQPVKFHSSEQQVWLPHLVEFYVEKQNKRYYRRHTFTDFMLFNVETAQSIQAPKGSYSFTNLSDQDVVGELVVRPQEGMTGEVMRLRFKVPAHGMVFKLVGPGKDVNLPMAAVASATFTHNGPADSIKVDALLLKETTVDVIPETAISEEP